jgi:hypothetical protein
MEPHQAQPDDPKLQQFCSFLVERLGKVWTTRKIAQRKEGNRFDVSTAISQ